MPTDRHADAAPAWVIRSVAVRTRDGPERLDQAYRRLTDDTPRQDAPSEPGPVPDRPAAAGAPQHRR
jgi:hypothetical protein